MKAVQIVKPGDIRLIDASIPVPPPGFVRVKIKAAAICATDLEVIDGNIAANYPLIPGHEWSGIVDAVGSDEDAHWIGKAVIGSNDVVCYKCDACRSGNWRYCKDFEEIGFKRDGAYAEYAVFPAYGLAEKPDNVTFEQAALCEPLGVALGTMKKANAAFGQTLLIFGAGSIGLSMLAVGKAMGMRKGMDQLCKRIELQKPSSDHNFYVMYTADRTIGQTLAQKVSAMGIEVPEERIVQVGAAIGSHIGPNACGIVYVAE